MRRGGINLLRLISILLIVAALALFFVELLSYSRARAHLPEGLTISGVPVGGLEKEEAIQRLLQVYSSPVELYYADQIILLSPPAIGFRLDTEVMLASAELARTETDFWQGFWDYIWNRPGEQMEIPLQYEYSTSELEAFLRDIAARYDQPPIPAEPIPGSTGFTPGVSGQVLEIARARELIGAIIEEPSNRRVNLPIVGQAPPSPSFEKLKVLLQQNLDVAGFDGLAVVYLQDLQTGEEIHFARLAGNDLATDPDIAFTAASAIKIGIVTTFYRYFDEPLDEEAEKWLREAIVFSGNGPSDWLMERMDGMDDRGSPGPVVVTSTLRELGFESTFIGGYFYTGSPLYIQPQTPGNQRTDVTTSPDPYNQTTASETGVLLADLYHCANGGGALLAAFPNEVFPSECQTVLDLLAQNKIGVLIEAGVPEGTRVAHKHGWTDSPLRFVADAGIVYSPGGNYVMTIWLWNDPEMIWEPTSKLVADLSRSVYNYYNPPQ